MPVAAAGVDMRPFPEESSTRFPSILHSDRFHQRILSSSARNLLFIILFRPVVPLGTFVSYFGYEDAWI